MKQRMHEIIPLHESNYQNLFKYKIIEPQIQKENQNKYIN